MVNILSSKTLVEQYYAQIEFKKQDAWVGVYWDKENCWICLIPCFPIHIAKKKSKSGYSLLFHRRVKMIKKLHKKGASFQEARDAAFKKYP